MGYGYYAVAALLIGILGGFCARCYQISNGKNFLYVLKISALNIAQNSRTAFCLPLKLLQGGLAQKTLSVIHALIHNALNYAVYPAQRINSNPAD